MSRASLTSPLAKFILATRRMVEETGEAEDRRICRLYLAHAAVILAKIVEDEECGAEVEEMEHVFGDLWLRDAAAYASLYAGWDLFKGAYQRSIHGMTLEERLSMLGLSLEFDRAVGKKDEDRIRELLTKCLLDPDAVQAEVERQAG